MMAEFQDVMKQWRRFCKSHDNCGECEFDGKGICGDAHLTDIAYAYIESRIMAWAAEHPEPVYPTWGDYLMSKGLLMPNWNERGNAPYDMYIHAERALANHIPEEIAQKLGLKPKGG